MAKRTARLTGLFLSASLIALTSSPEFAQASGFAIREQSGSSQGHSFASASTGVEDISNMFFNPSLLTFHDGNQFVVVNSLIVPQSEFKNGSASFTPGVGGGAIGNGTGFTGLNDIGRSALVAATYAMISPAEDLRLGLGVTAPFGLKTSNEEGWIGRYHALDSRLTTLNINPTLAYRINSYLSVGAGFVAQYADAKLSNAIDFGTIGAGLGGTPGAEDGRAVVRADDWGFGFTLGLTVTPMEGTRIGAGYRSFVSHTLEGDADFDLGSGVGTLVSGATGAFTNTGASASAKLPEQVSVGIHQDVGDDFALMGEAQWTHWSRFRELRIKFDNPAQADSVTAENWTNTWFFALGGTYRPDEDWTFKLGVAFDESPVPDRTRTPRIPDEDRYWISGGVSYDPFDWLSVSLAYTHIFLPDADIDLGFDDPNHASRGSLEGTYESSIDIVVLQGRITF
ncbi:OmpP1/FadL family transporter [Pelagibius sp.]|uniref:OmpP1/FadL family transporter n=1 Tax=Pelagibius sp. TaxID=1931238 RepID=UPI002638E8F3|nr:outer membrane protein transport protein [Pelagibius sp.]